MQSVKIQSDPTFVTAPSIASLDEFMSQLTGAWKSGILTHNGPLVQLLEKKLEERLGVKNMLSVVNGTVALQLPLKAYKLKGDIITTPFSWVATCSSILWENCRPVFVDIDPDTFNIDPSKLEDAITDRTVAIMPVHVFSNPCDIEAIETLSKKHKLKVVYDAAHALFVDYKGKSLLSYGDVSATSFHATKIFNTGEGGGLVTNDDSLHELLKSIRFFGHDDSKEIVRDGCNGKMTEIHAALGLANLEIMDAVLARRREIYDQYFVGLKELEYITWQKISPESYNYSYMPIVFDSEKRLLDASNALAKQNIFGRRYFHPSLNTVKVLGHSCSMPLSESLSKRILCLPSHQRLSDSKISEINNVIKQAY